MKDALLQCRDENQLHAAIVEIIAEKNAEVKYSTVQNWYPGDKDGKGGIFNFVTKRGLCRGDNSKISWTQIETGSAITWKYPSCILKGDNSVGEFYSVAVTNNHQQADTGTKMIHIGKNTKSTIVSKRDLCRSRVRTATGGAVDSVCSRLFNLSNT
ncbi:MAG: SufD family Fe-S cluster assembly protein [Marinilabiliales bacterium]|nr:SufD family Fe-S cluster assembly protein [Marinilabiliales bacterium]